MLTNDDVKQISDIVANAIQGVATKGDINNLKTEMHQRFDVVDNDLKTVLSASEGDNEELEIRIDDHERRINKLESPPAVAHTIRK